MTHFDSIIIGAGASGLMCAIEAAKRTKRILALDHAHKPGNKILISGGGLCNFTNLHIDQDHYISQNKHFCISALKRFSQFDFISLIERYEIPYHEREHGRLFCNRSGQDIVNMLLKECRDAGVTIIRNCDTLTVKKNDVFTVTAKDLEFRSDIVVIATGGLSFQSKSGLGFGYNIAHQFGLNVIKPRPGLVPLTYNNKDSQAFATLSGISVDALVSYKDISFRENLLFTHRGLSGPVILQISSYWIPGDSILINLIPDIDVTDYLNKQKENRPKRSIKTILVELLPKRLVEKLLEGKVPNKPINQFTRKDLDSVAMIFRSWYIKPNGTESYRTAEVTVGGVDTNELSSKTLESIKVKGLYFIGEVVDVTGHLGGYNLQWAWSSGYCAGQFI